MINKNVIWTGMSARRKRGEDPMRRSLIGLAALGVCLFCLTGCMFGSMEEMYALPKSSQAYVDLQSKINAEKGTAEYIAPLSGENRQTIQLVDVDGDGRQEAVSFFRDSAAEKPLKIVIFKQDDRGDYQVSTRIEGMGSEIESIDYLPLNDEPGKDILVSWQATASVHTLVGYALSEGQSMEIFRSGYSQYLTGDLDRDGRYEIILAQTDGSHLRLEYYDCRQGTLEMASSAPLSEGATDISSWTVGVLEEDIPALFVTSDLDEALLVTDVFTADQEGLKNVSLRAGDRRSACTYQYSAGVRPADRNGDGLTEVPLGVPVEAYGESTVDQFWWLDWMHYRADGSSQRVMTTYQSTDGSWYLEIPDTWTDAFAMSRQEQAAEGVRSVTFARRTGETVDPFLTIRCLVGGDRAEHAKQADQFILYADNTTVFTGQFLPSRWDCGLDQKELTALFHVGSGPWTGKSGT